MSQNLKAILFVGIPLEQKERTKPKTKYNEETGEPYETAVHDYNYVVVEGQGEIEFASDKDNPDEFITWEPDENGFMYVRDKITGELYYGHKLMDVDDRDKKWVQTADQLPIPQPVQKLVDDYFKQHSQILPFRYLLMLDVR